MLVVEDDAGLQTLFTTLLTRDGFRVECVSDGAQALERISRCGYSVVLLDLMMRGTNGFDVLRRFAESRPAMLRKTIVTTGVSERELEKVDRKTVFAVLRKPFDIDCLISTVEECARQARGGGDGGGGQGDGGLDRSVRKLEATLPELQRMLSSDVACDDEALLRHELRRVVRKLGGMLSVAACVEADSRRAKRYEKVGKAAARLADR